MNLVDDKWIPVVRIDGSFDKVSLTGAFDSGLTIYDFACSAHEKIALMRLLLCIIHANTDCSSRSKWLACKKSIAASSIEYLESHRGCFEMGGSGQRFLQYANLNPLNTSTAIDEDNPEEDDDEGEAEASFADATKLDVAFPSPKMGFVLCKTDVSELNVPLSLICTQMFSGGGLLGAVSIDGVAVIGKGKRDKLPKFKGLSSIYPKASSSHCSYKSKAHVFAFGRNLIETLWLNLLVTEFVDDKVVMGRLIWEMMPSGFDDKEAINNARNTYLGNLIPMLRLIKVDGNSVVLGRGMVEYDPAYRDAFEARTIHKSKEDGSLFGMPIAIKKGESMWRNLPALLSYGILYQGDREASLNMRNLDASGLADFEIWVGGNIFEDKSRAVLGTSQSWIHIPSGMLSSGDVIKFYHDGVEYAKNACYGLREATKSYRRSLLTGTSAKTSSGKTQIGGDADAAVAFFWNILDQHASELISLSLDSSESFAKIRSQFDHPEHPWGTLVRESANQVLRQKCPCNSADRMVALCKAENVLIKNAKPKRKASK